MKLLGEYWLLILGLLMGIGGWSWRRALGKGEISKSRKKKRLWATILMLAGGWCFMVRLLQLVFGTKEAEAFSVSIWPAPLVGSRKPSRKSGSNNLIFFMQSQFLSELLKHKNTDKAY